MAINISQSFHRTSANAVDETLTLTKAQMLTVNDNLMPSKYLTVCQDDGAIYLYDKSNTVDVVTGRFRKLEAEGSGGHTIVDGEDTAMTQRTNLKFDDCFTVADNSEDDQTEVSVNPLASGDMDDIVYPLPTVPYRTTSCGYTPVGTIISVMGTSAPLHYLPCNGQTVSLAEYSELAEYFKTQFGSYTKFGGDGVETFGIPDLRGEFLRGTGTNSHANQGDGDNVGTHQDGTEHLGIVESKKYHTVYFPYSSDDGDFKAAYYADKDITPQSGSINLSGTDMPESNVNSYIYTSRPTNTSVLYCIATKDIYIDARTNYTTYEKVVGSWVNGKPIYQRTFTGTMPVISTQGEYQTVTVDIGALVDKFISEEVFVLTNNGQMSRQAFEMDITDGVTGYLRMSCYTNAYQVSEQQNTVVIRDSISKDSEGTYYLTVRYTKTTD